MTVNGVAQIRGGDGNHRRSLIGGAQLPSSLQTPGNKRKANEAQVARPTSRPRSSRSPSGSAIRRSSGTASGRRTSPANWIT